MKASYHNSVPFGCEHNLLLDQQCCQAKWTHTCMHMYLHVLTHAQTQMLQLHITHEHINQANCAN